MFLSSFCEIRCARSPCVSKGLKKNPRPPVFRLAPHLACAVDGHLEVRAAVKHSGRKHAHGDGLAEPAGRGHQHLLRQVVPPVDLEDPLVVSRKGPVLLALPEDAGARSDEVVVEHPLVERALPAPAVDGLQSLAAPVHPLEPVVLLFDGRRHVVLQRGPAPLPVQALVLPLLRHPVVVQKVLVEADRGALRVVGGHICSCACARGHRL
jgi:hypothetical protein